MVEVTGLDRLRPVIEVHHVGKRFRGGAVCPQDITLQLFPSEITIITGGNGAGKSTLLSIMGLMKEQSWGDLVLLGHNVQQLQSRYKGRLQDYIEFFPQKFFGLQKGSALWNLTHLLQDSYSPGEAKRVALMALETVQTEKRFDVNANVVKLSGGEKARVAIALALARKRPICLVDEVFSAVDHGSYASLMGLFRKLADQGVCVVLISQTRELEEYADRVITLEAGHVVSDERNSSPKGSIEEEKQESKSPTPDVIAPFTYLKALFTYRGHTLYVSSVAWSPDGKYLASGSSDRTVRVINPKTGGEIFIYQGHKYDVDSVAWSPDGKCLAFGCRVGHRRTTMHFTFLGGASEVGASCTLVHLAGHRLLIDGGMRPAARAGQSRLPDLTPLDAMPPEAILITHAHIDHTGALPLIASLFPTIPIYATESTRVITELLLRDSVRIMEQEGLTPDGETPLYTAEQVDAFLGRITVVGFQQPLTLFPGLTVRFLPAGHILGAAMLFFETSEGQVLHTGDISVTDQRTIKGLDLPHLPQADVMICEGTYGNHTLPKRKEQERQLAQTVQATLARGGRVLLPAFAVGRAQELVLILKAYRASGMISPVPIFLDGMVRSVCLAYQHQSHDLVPALQRYQANARRPLFADPAGSKREANSERTRLMFWPGFAPSIG